MPSFNVCTNLPLEEINQDELHKQVFLGVCRLLKVHKKHVLIRLEKSPHDSSTTQYTSYCSILHFKELTTEYKSTLTEAAYKIKELFNKVFETEAIFKITFSDHKDQLLIDWSKTSIVGSIPVQDQKDTMGCWAYAFADTMGCTYALANPLIKSTKEVICSPQELLDWLYFAQKLPQDTEVDMYGTYGCSAPPVLRYVNENGISLLKNYKINIEKRPLKAFKDEDHFQTEFETMKKERGPRIFYKESSVLRPETGSNVLSIDAVYKFLSGGVAYGQLRYCDSNKCKICPGFSAFSGKGVYDEPQHSQNYEPCHHAVLVYGVGNEHGKDYLRIRNSHGTMWPRKGKRKGCGDVNLKFFTRIYSLKNPEKKDWNAEELLRRKEGSSLKKFENLDISQVANTTRKAPSRSSRRKKAKRRWLRATANIGKRTVVCKSKSPPKQNQSRAEFENKESISQSKGPLKRKPLEQEEHENEIVQQNQLSVETDEWNGITSKRKRQKRGTEKNSSAERHENENLDLDYQNFDPNQPNKSTTGLEIFMNNALDFDKLLPLRNLPKEGDVIGYRILELSSTWTPEVSGFRVGSVLWYKPESRAVMLIPVPEYPVIRENPNEDDESAPQTDNSVYNEDGSLEIDFSSLIDVRIVKLSNSDSSKEVTDCSNSNSSKAVADDKVNDSSPTNCVSNLPRAGNGEANLLDHFSEVLNAKKAQLYEENSWIKDTPGKKSWSYRSLRGSALGPLMALLRSNNDI